MKNQSIKIKAKIENLSSLLILRSSCHWKSKSLFLTCIQVTNSLSPRVFSSTSKGSSSFLHINGGKKHVIMATISHIALSRAISGILNWYFKIIISCFHNVPLYQKLCMASSAPWKKAQNILTKWTSLSGLEDTFSNISPVIIYSSSILHGVRFICSVFIKYLMNISAPEILFTSITEMPITLFTHSYPLAFKPILPLNSQLLILGTRIWHLIT